MQSEFLIGSSPRKGRKSSRENAIPPPPVGIGFIGVLIFCSSVIVALGFWRVHSVFALRDDEMETRRLQEIAQHQRDHFKALTSKLSQLQRTQVLKPAAEGSLGMAMPEPQLMETLSIPKETNERWLAAAGMSDQSSAEKEEN